MAKETCIDCNFCVSQDGKKGIFFKCLKQKIKIENPFCVCRNDKNKNRQPSSNYVLCTSAIVLHASAHFHLTETP